MSLSGDCSLVFVVFLRLSHFSLSAPSCARSMLDSTEEYLNDLSPNYQFDLRPEYKLKVRKR